jgi:hypothetical protein
MATLSRESRKTLERVILAARAEAEAGARKALDQLAVANSEPWTTMTADQQSLRRRLRARGRQLGDRLENRGKQGLGHLVAECAYEQWHRMLFARFLAERELLIEPTSGVSVSVDDCKELARAGDGDWISLASAFAQGMLPQIFRADDAVLEVTLPQEHRQPLEQLLGSLPSGVFLADDGLGWVYQFWQSDEKEAVNKSGDKIGADQLPAVTQLFTEDYMVDFLLDNTLGAWWAGQTLSKMSTVAASALSEEQLRSAVALPGCQWKYLRFMRASDGQWFPAAGAFDGWPKSAKELRCLDPCMGSGHFVVAMFERLVALRAAEEELEESAAVAAVIRDNLFGLEIDPRCTQIGAFNLALAAWRRVGYCKLPAMNLACSGLSPNVHEADWLSMAGDSEKLRNGMQRLYRSFKDAPVLGSLVNPRLGARDMYEADYHELRPLLEEALARESQDGSVEQMSVTARGLAIAAEILASEFTLVATNVPYLGRGKQVEVLQDYCERVYPEAKTDLATCFLGRCLELCSTDGSVAIVTPQNWLFLASYRSLREQLLRASSFDVVARLGAGGFQTPMWDFNVALVTLSRRRSEAGHRFFGLDVSEHEDPLGKANALRSTPGAAVRQDIQLKNPDSKVMLDEREAFALLASRAASFQGIKTGDDERVRRCFWEVPTASKRWRFYQSTVDATKLYGGLESVIDWLDEGAGLARRQGMGAWGKRGVMVSQMGQLPVALFLGDAFDSNASPIIPKDVADLPALWAMCSSASYSVEVRKVDQSLKPTNTSLVQVPFDLPRWQEAATEQYPHGLPKPFSGDSTQWLFNGHPRGSDNPLHVAVARLLGYLWPRQSGSTFPDCPAVGPDGVENVAVHEGIVCLPAIRGEDSAAERLGRLLAAAYGADWNASILGELLAAVGCGGSTLDDWLRDRFFEQHCDHFHRRPFVWHVWDGRRDGFSALVNCHRLTKANLEKLTYAYLGDWISRQDAAVGSGEAGGEGRLVAAQQLQEELKKILEGEPPYDMFVRWKPIARQPIGWDPDVNDGVRANIRPFLLAADLGKKGAGILRARPNIKLDKDRGKEPSRSKDEFPWFWGWDEKARDFAGGSTFDGNRWNDLHYSREFKIAARRKKGLP